jgi:hypothetical protein
MVQNMRKEINMLQRYKKNRIYARGKGIFLKFRSEGVKEFRSSRVLGG